MGAEAAEMDEADEGKGRGGPQILFFGSLLFAGRGSVLGQDSTRDFTEFSSVAFSRSVGYPEEQAKLLPENQPRSIDPHLPKHIIIE